jgi:carbon monoxide dehydrogenase subunit G
VKEFTLPLLAAVICLTGCQKNIQTNEAVRAGVIKHLSQNSNLSLGSMDVEVASVTFRDNDAEATISFKPKGGDASTGMSMRYTLEKKGGEWVVKKKADSGMGHGAAPGAGMPQGTGKPMDHPPMGPGVASGAGK